MAKPTILIIGTLDTKEEEILFLREQIHSYGTCLTQLLDVGRTPVDVKSLPIPPEEVIPPHLEAEESMDGLTRGEYINKTILRCIPIVQQLVQSHAIHGIVAAGGSSGSSLATALMRKACPIGFPKLMVSTVASGDIKPYIEETDITMMYSVVDIAGVNSILRRILSNAAGSIVGMTTSYAKSLAPTNGAHAIPGKRIAITMFGVTTPCVDQIRKILSSPPHDVSNFEVIVFHATGAGGRAMERLISEGQIDALVDLTTTEIPDHIAGGVFSAGPNRLEAAAKKGVPIVLSVGACDMVNFGAKDTVPDKYKDRNLFVHNPTVTLMRTTREENAQIGQFIVDKLRTHAIKPELIKVLLPTGGVSMIDKPGQPFHDPEADLILFDTISEGLAESGVEVERFPEDINDEKFSAEVVKAILASVADPKMYRLANQRRRRWSFDHGLV